jgi:putative FmdB family regulatory protein
MPIYNYRCTKCPLELERIVPTNERDEEFLCPKCNQPTQREISIPSPPVFNGTGFTEKFYPKN